MADDNRRLSIESLPLEFGLKPIVASWLARASFSDSSNICVAFHHQNFI